ncbi:hypothetical protein ACLB1O_18910 [Escherichia coli]
MVDRTVIIAGQRLAGCADFTATYLVDIDELVQRCPQLVQQSDTVEWDDAQGTLKAWRRLQIGQLTVKASRWRNRQKTSCIRRCLIGIRDKGLSVLNWTAEAEQLRLRLLCAAKWLPEYDWPAVDNESLLATLETWLLPHMTGVHSLRGLKSLTFIRHYADYLIGNAATSG